MGDHYFISYSKSDGKQIARRLADDLLKTPPSIQAWLDERELQPGPDWDDQIVNALRECTGLIFVMTPDSVHSKSECKREWSRALRYKKPIIPLLFDSSADIPYRLEPRQYIDFTGNYGQALAVLRSHMQWRFHPHASDWQVNLSPADSYYPHEAGRDLTVPARPILTCTSTRRCVSFVCRAWNAMCCGRRRDVGPNLPVRNNTNTWLCQLSE